MRRLMTVAVMAMFSSIALAAPAEAASICSQPDPPPSCEAPDPEPETGDSTPRGGFESVTFTGNGVRVVGWAADFDEPGALQVHVYVDGTYKGALTAGVYRPDIARTHPYFSAYHGYDGVVPAPHGAHTVCVYAINVVPPNTSPLPNRELGCKPYDAPAVSNIQSYYSGQWLLAFDDNVLGEAGFQVTWQYYTWYTLPGGTRIATPRTYTYPVPAHEGMGRVTVADTRPANSYRVTVSAPGFGGASADL
ncbi:hypothetical protein ABZS66_41885 [Dactylosporangium sp. NPDC005572]|uniref:hypothetical protein n=1 Tax=Dactylosporangium sp. NPDC005572 TaxID=3156889 RepID=UPI0033B0C8CC